MDYMNLANELMSNMRLLHSAKMQKKVDEALQGETYVLHYLAYRDAETLPGDISIQMNVSSARIAQTLNNMEKKGWITRRIDSGDRRKIIVSLTAEGRMEEAKHTKTILGLVSEMLSLLDVQDALDYVRITGKLAEIISKTNK